MHDEAPQTVRRRRILVVDDDRAARQALAELLGDEGFEVRTAHDGVSAFAQLAGFAPDVIVTDVRMPRMDGVALAQAIRELPGVPPRIIFLSATPPPAEVSQLFLAKPIALDELLALL
jgi:CheY-like chemotaxis protein